MNFDGLKHLSALGSVLKARSYIETYSFLQYLDLDT